MRVMHVVVLTGMLLNIWSKLRNTRTANFATSSELLVPCGTFCDTRGSTRRCSGSSAPSLEMPRTVRERQYVSASLYR